MQGIEAARVLGNQPPLSGSVGHLHRRRGRCERHPVGRVSTLPLGPLQTRAAKNRPTPVAAPPGRTLREADQAHKLGPLASDQVGDPTARRQTPERERVKRVCGNHWRLSSNAPNPRWPRAERCQRSWCPRTPSAARGRSRPRPPPIRIRRQLVRSGVGGGRSSARGLTGSHALSLGEPTSDRLLTASAPSPVVGRRDGQCALPRCRQGRRSRRPW